MNFIPILVACIGFIISNYLGNFLFIYLVKKLAPVKREKDGRWVIFDGTESDLMTFRLMHNVMHHADMMSYAALGYILVTSQGGAFTLLFGPAIVNVVAVIILIFSAKFSRPVFARLINYKKAG